MAHNNTTTRPNYGSSCYDDEGCHDMGIEISNVISLIPSVIIIFVLTVLTQRMHTKSVRCCGKRPGILPPVDFLSIERNRFSYSLAYGCIVVSCTNMVLDKLEGRPGREMVEFKGNSWIKGSQGIVVKCTVAIFFALGGIVTVLLITIIYLPFFLCLSTSAKLVGSFLGAIYASFRCAGFLLNAVVFPVDSHSMLPYWPFLFDAPPIVLHALLVVRYLAIMTKEIWIRFCKRHYKRQINSEDKTKVIACRENYHHVKKLLSGPPKSKSARWHQKVLHFVYQPNPEFKFSIAVLATVIIAGLIVYQLLILILGLGTKEILQLRSDVIGNSQALMTYQKENKELYDAIIVTFDVSTGIIIGCPLIAALITYFQMYRMLVAHRNHVMKLIKSNRKFLPRALPDPSRMVGRSLEFCGYQIAYFLWSFLVTTTVLLLLIFFITFASLILPHFLPPSYVKWIHENILMRFVRIVAMFILAIVAQKILALFVFRDRSINSKVINIDNRRCYLLVSFFFLFFNILVGVMSCSLRVLKGMVLGILFLGRIDRPFLMKGFTSIDKAYIAYLGFLHLQVAHKHPVVLVFCQLLWDKIDGIDRHGELEERKPDRPRVSRVALNKWLVAVTKLNNPTLISNDQILNDASSGKMGDQNVKQEELECHDVSHEAQNVQWVSFV